jgi:hypothetical protein
MQRTVPLFLALATACASTASTPDIVPDAQTVRVAGAGGVNVRGSAPDQRSDTIWTPLPKVWEHMPAVYAAFEIPISDLEPRTYTVGTTGFKVYRRLARTNLSKYLDCGRTQVEQNADSYEIHLSVMSVLKSVGEGNVGTTVTTTVQAMARPMAFPGEYFPCRSKGLLETQMATAIKVRSAP